jgi:hypothetical protein
VPNAPGASLSVCEACFFDEESRHAGEPGVDEWVCVGGCLCVEVVMHCGFMPWSKLISVTYKWYALYFSHVLDFSCYGPGDSCQVVEVIEEADLQHG